MKTLKITYWIVTGMVSLALLSGGSMMLMKNETMVGNFVKMGMPLYLLPLLGIAKVSAAIGLILPFFPRLKEWIYAGITILLTGAIWVHIAAGDAAGAPGAFMVLLLMSASYFIYRRIEAKKKTNPVLNSSN